MTDVTENERPVVDEDPWELENQHWATLRPWRTSRLPPLVGMTGALDILGVDQMTLRRWLRPGSGTATPWGGFGPDRTYMLTPAAIDRGKAKVWCRSDVEVFAEQIGPRRTWTKPRPRKNPPKAKPQRPAVGGLGAAVERVLRVVAERGPAPRSELARALGLADRTVLLHLKQLRLRDLVVDDGDGFVVTAAGRELLSATDALRAADG